MQITIEITKSQNTYTIYNNLQENLNINITGRRKKYISS